MIPADKWPKNATSVVFHQDGDAYFVMYDGGKWFIEGTSSISIPEGHDWRVPVMRPTVKESLTVDLERIQRLASSWIIEAGGPGSDAQNACAEALLGLIDGQEGVE